jgi:hypothetical protein
MGDIADMMLDGTLCQGCGVYLDGERFGVPSYCDACSGDQDETPINRRIGPNAIKVNCPKCQRRVKEVGLAQHMRDKHGT